jgi:hypothetical protein
MPENKHNKRLRCESWHSGADIALGWREMKAKAISA